MNHLHSTQIYGVNHVRQNGLYLKMGWSLKKYPEWDGLKNY